MSGDQRDSGDLDARLRLAFASLSETDQLTAECPSTERIWDAAHGRATPADTERIVDHLAGCGVCAEAWRLAVALPATDDVDAAPPRADDAALADDSALTNDSAPARSPARPATDAVVPLHDPARPPRRSQWLRYAASGATALAMAAAIILLVRARGGSRALVVAHLDEPEVRRAGRPHRADSPAVGDVLRMRATAPSTTHAELRIYRDGHELVARCPAPGAPTAGCERRGNHITVDVTLPRIGTYRAVLLTSPASLPAPSGSLDADSKAAANAGAEVQLSEDIDVL